MSAPQVRMQAVITCPNCSKESVEEMPDNACVQRWQCPACGKVSGAQAGDCCVFCSYADTDCPPEQRGDCC